MEFRNARYVVPAIVAASLFVFAQVSVTPATAITSHGPFRVESGSAAGKDPNRSSHTGMGHMAQKTPHPSHAASH